MNFLQESKPSLRRVQALILNYPPKLFAKLAIAVIACSAAPARAGLVLSGPGYTDYVKTVIAQTNEMVAAGRHDEALDRLRKLRAEKKDLLSGDVLLFEILAARGEIPKGRQVLDQFTVVNPPSFDVFFAYSKLAASEGRWFDAFVHAQLALNQPLPLDWSKAFGDAMKLEAQLLLLSSCEGRAAWAQCAEVLSAIDESKKADPRILAFQGKSAFHGGDPKAAYDHFAALAKVDNKSASPQLVLSRLYSQQENWLEAENWLKKAVTDVPVEQQAEPRIEFANWLLNQNRPNDAIGVLRGVTAAEHVDAADLCRGMALLMTGDAKAAIEKLRAVVARTKNAFEPTNVLAMALTSLDTANANNEAYELASQNVRAHPNQGEAWSTLAWTQLRTGQTESADISFLRAIQTGVISRDAAYFLSEFHRSQSRPEKAEEFRNAALNGQGPFFFAARAK